MSCVWNAKCDPVGNCTSAGANLGCDKAGGCETCARGDFERRQSVNPSKPTEAETLGKIIDGLGFVVVRPGIHQGQRTFEKGDVILWLNDWHADDADAWEQFDRFGSTIKVQYYRPGKFSLTEVIINRS